MQRNFAKLYWNWLTRNVHMSMWVVNFNMFFLAFVENIFRMTAPKENKKKKKIKLKWISSIFNLPSFCSFFDFIFDLLQHLNNLLEYYLEPMKRETFLSNAEINALFGNIQDIVTFQRQFLRNLEEAIELEPDFNKFEHSSQFKVIIETIQTIIHIFFSFYHLQWR